MIRHPSRTWRERCRPVVSLLLALVVLFVASAPAAWAQPSGSQLEQYEEYLQRGSRAFEAKDFETALLLFGKAQEIHDHPRLRFSMARIYEELDQCVAAKMMYVILMENDATPEELRKEAGSRLASIEDCGPSPGPAEGETVTDPADGTATEVAPASSSVVPSVVSEPVRAAARSRTIRNVGVWSIGVGGGLTLAGLVIATTVFVPERHRDCYGLGVTIDEQIGACEALAEREQVEFFEAHVMSRRVVQTHRVGSTALIAAGLVGTGLGLGLLYFDRSGHVALNVGFDRVAVVARF